MIDRSAEGRLVDRGSGDPARGDAQPGRAIRSDVDARIGHVQRVRCCAPSGPRSGCTMPPPASSSSRCRATSGTSRSGGPGLVGACARDRRLLNVPDCYADPRFDQQVDHRSGYDPLSLTLPLIDHAGTLVDVMQVLNRIDGDLSGRGRAARERARRPMRRRAAARADDRVADRRREDGARNGDRAGRAVGHASAGDAGRRRLRRAPPFRPALLTGGDTFDLAPFSDGLSSCWETPRP